MLQRALVFKISEFYIQIVKFHEQVSVFVWHVVDMQILKLLAFVSYVNLTRFSCVFHLQIYLFDAKGY